MRLCNETVTVFNARVDPGTRAEVYAPTVLRGVGWRCETLSAVAENGLRAANRFVVRIPAEVDAEESVYAEPGEYRRAADVSGLWTLQKGDVIARGEVDEALTPAQVKERFGEDRVLTVLGVTDDRSAPNGKHWKVTGA